jgi:thiol-disulfide isomerase/thioredoxin
LIFGNAIFISLFLEATFRNKLQTLAPPGVLCLKGTLAQIQKGACDPLRSWLNKRVIRVFAALVFGLVIRNTAEGQNPRAILDHVGDTYANLHTYDFHGTIQATTAIDGIGYRFRVPVEIAQGNAPNLPLAASLGLGAWTRTDAVKGSPPGATISLPGPTDFAQITSNIKSARVLREETLQANGKAARCYVMDLEQAAEASSGGPSHRTVWIDKATLLVLRTAFHTAQAARTSQPELPLDWVITFSSYQLNGPNPNWLVGMQEVAEKENAALSAKMIGTQAPFFMLQDLNGQEVSLSALRDKVVLLSFWATSCSPCRSELPLLAKLERDWSEKGVVLARITDEPAQVVDQFLKRTRQNFSSLVNGEAVAKQYGVRGVPTLVVIDKGGKIVAYDMGELDETALLARLKRGLE